MVPLLEALGLMEERGNEGKSPERRGGITVQVCVTPGNRRRSSGICLGSDLLTETEEGKEGGDTGPLSSESR